MKKTLVVFVLSFLSLVLGFTLAAKSKFKPALTGVKDVSSFSASLYKTFNNAKVNKESHTLPSKGVKEYVLEVSSAEVVVHTQKYGVLDASYNISYNGDANPFNFSKVKDSLFLNLDQKTVNALALPSVRLDLYLPPAKTTNFGSDLKIKLQAGSVTVKRDLFFDNFALDVSAGSFKSKFLNFNKGEIKLMAGEVEFLDTAATEVRMEISGGAAHFNSRVNSKNFEAHVRADALRYGLSEGLKKNFTLTSNVTLGDLSVVDGYKKSGNEYIFGDGSDRVYIEVDMGSAEVY